MPLSEELSRLLGTRWAGRALHFEAEVDSTNRWAKELARGGAAHGTLCLCDYQTAGRGRLQRRWQANPGEALLMSLIVRPVQLPPERAPLIVLLGALAVCRALQSMGVDAQIKWPNDIVCGAKKLCGMLLEMGTKETSVDYAVWGVGINVRTHPVSEETVHAGSVCEALGREVSRAQVASQVLSCFEECYDAWEREGEEALLEAYAARCVSLKGRICALAPDGTMQEGTGVGICEDGALVMRRDDGSEVVLHAGDVSVRGVMGYV